MAADDQAACPFCQAAIAADLLRFGGHCPKCLIEIPGEETPTDPGVEARQRAHAEERAAKASNRRTRGVAAAVVLAGVVGAGAWYLTRPEPEPVGPIDDGWAIVPLSMHEDLAIKSPEDAASSARGSAGRSRHGSGGAGTTTASTVGGPESTPAQGSIIPKPGADLAKDPLGAFSIGVGPASKMPDAIVLTDPGQIESMIQQVLGRGSRQIQQCYEQQLNEDEGLRGAWYVVIVVGTKGAATEVHVTAMETSNPALEACLKRNIQSWKFQRINEPVEINKTFRFSPSG